MNELIPLVQPLSIDEAVLDLSGTERLHGAAPAVVLARFASAVERQVGIRLYRPRGEPVDGKDRRKPGKARRGVLSD
jgi:hypothetical protein